MLNMFIHQMDIIGAYLESLLGDNKLSIFIKLSLGMDNLRQIQEGLLCRLLKSLYGLKQSKRLWNQNIIVFYKRIGFWQFNEDFSIFIRYLGIEISIINMYVNNFLLALNTMNTFDMLKQSLVEEYDTKDLGEVKTIIR